MKYVFSTVFGAFCCCSGYIASASGENYFDLLRPKPGPDVVISVNMTIDLIVNGQEVFASRDFELRYNNYSLGHISTWRGTALVFQPEGQPPIFGLLPLDNGGSQQDVLANDCGFHSSDPATFMQMVKGWTGSCDIPDKYVPFLTYFTDPNDPYSIQKLVAVRRPTAAPNEAQIVSAVISRTNAPVSFDPPTALDLLPWLPHALTEQGTIYPDRPTIPQMPMHLSMIPRFFYKKDF